MLIVHFTFAIFYEFWFVNGSTANKLLFRKGKAPPLIFLCRWNTQLISSQRQLPFYSPGAPRVNTELELNSGSGQLPNRKKKERKRRNLAVSLFQLDEYCSLFDGPLIVSNTLVLQKKKRDSYCVLVLPNNSSLIKFNNAEIPSAKPPKCTY